MKVWVQDENGNNNLVDIVDLVEKTLEHVRADKLTEIQQAYASAIYNTFTSTAFDGTTIETYACDLISQSRINGEVTTAIAVKSGYSTEPVSWKNVDQAQCVQWQPQNMINLGSDLHKFLTDQSDYLEILIVYISDIKRTMDELNAVAWGMIIPTT